MTALAQHMTEQVVPHVPVRQFVLSLPHRLRYWLAYDHARSLGVLRVVLRAVFDFYRREARRVTASYGASKHAVVGLSKGLRVEAKRHNVRVSVLCPGVIRTPLLSGGRYGTNRPEDPDTEAMMRVWERFRPMNVDVFAAKAVAAVARNEAIIIIPGWWKLICALDRISPALSMQLSLFGLERARATFEAAGVRRSERHEVSAAKDALPPAAS